MPQLDEAGRNILFREARSHVPFADTPVTDAVLKAVWDLARLGPTSANCQPLRIVFVRSPEAKEKLRPALSAGNVDKTMAAPVTAIFAQDLEFYENLPRLFPQADARSWFVGNEAVIRATAFRNSTLQAAYFMLAARALGLACGPMSGFDNDKVDATFFPEGRIVSNFICTLGYPAGPTSHPRNPRLDFDEACRVE
ncbi:malonic semialdehyde reductase [Telmatospirillum sp. J64-1]|uniref:malonic semialdehyde reductase n=1 Tax=Telmatospirillum sp. J64-1 TaxID=2502183 RepID=UPI00115E865E|nr:malonic semialdehyde reductase [Telmatospirillum sp. J64-1]